MRGLAVGQLARAVGCDALECVAERPVARALACPQGRLGRAEHARALGRGSQEALEQRDHVGVRRRELDAPLRERDGRLRELTPGQTAEPAVGVLETGRHAGHGARPRPHEEDLLAGAEIDDVGLERRHRRAAVALARHRNEAVDGERSPPRSLERDEEASASGPGERRLGDPGCECRSHACIDGRAARAQHLGPDFRRRRMPCGDGTPRRAHSEACSSRAGRTARRDRRRSRAPAGASGRASARAPCCPR